MPVNYLHSLLHRVGTGWDPIPGDYARSYSDMAWGERRPELIDQLADLLGGLQGKRVLDLGGGPGQYSVMFAQRGARVTWHDVSRTYLAIARNRAEAARVVIDFSLGYLEDAKRFSNQPFDLVFNRVCWYYARGDRHFSRLVYSLVKPGGVAYVECNTPEFSHPEGWRKVQYWLNEHLWIKVGHPVPPHGRIAELFRRMAVSKLTTDYSSPIRDIVIFTKA